MPHHDDQQLPRRGARAAWWLAAIIALGFSGALPAASLAIPPQDVVAQQTSAPAAEDQKVLTLEDYPRWNRISSTGLSPDGRWMSYSYEPLDGDGTLYVRDLEGDTVHEIPRGENPQFSGDSRWVAYFVGLPQEEREKLQRDRQPVTRKAELLELASGAKHTEEDVAAMTFSDDGAFSVVKKRKADREAEHDGTDLVLRELATGVVQNIGNVDEYAFDDDSSMLAYTVDAAAGTGNGIYLLELGSRVLRPLDSGSQRYARISWNEEGTALAGVRGTKPEDKRQRDNELLVFTGLGEGGDSSGTSVSGGATASNGSRWVADAAKLIWDPADDPDFPAGYVLSEFRGLEWSDDDSRIFIGIKEQKPEPEESDESRADVDVWHWRDERVQSVQMRRAEQDRRSTYTSVLHLPGGGVAPDAAPKFVRLTDESMPSIDIAEGGRWGVGRYDEPYRYEVTWGGGRADSYRVDVATGERALMVEGLGRPMGVSPDGEWYLFLEDGQIEVQSLETLEVTDLSAIAGVDFVDHRDDHPYEKPAYGVAGWSADGTAVIVYHDFDVWSLPLPVDDADGAATNGDGRAVNLTRGVGDRQQIRFRYVDLDREGGGFFGRRGGGRATEIDLSEPLLLSAYGERTKKSGYWALEVGEDPQPLVWVDRSVGSLEKAEDAERALFTRQTAVEFPDLWVADAISEGGFAAARKITDANPQQSEYAWTPGRVLIDYTDRRGNELQATLTLPAGYEEGRRYPMLVYFYETMSQRHHQYSMPAYDDRPHFSTYASNGYLVLMPDIVYTEGRPGSSAVDDLTSAVEKVIELGYADPERIGLQGHSWGGYQSSYSLTQTDLFAAVVTGAPVTNLVSFYDELYKSSGNVQQGITERGQVRMGTTPWEDWDLYRSQSPVHQAENISTPFLILHGTDDGAVDWHQGLEYYNAARRLGKEVILLSYPGEGHHLGRKENQIDFQIRMKQFFDHHLKGEPAPPWMTDGVPFLEKGSGLHREERTRR